MRPKYHLLGLAIEIEQCRRIGKVQSFHLSKRVYPQRSQSQRRTIKQSTEDTAMKNLAHRLLHYHRLMMKVVTLV